MLKIKSADIMEKISIPREGGTWDEKRDGKEKKKFDRWGIPKRTEKYVGKDLCMSLAWEKCISMILKFRKIQQFTWELKKKSCSKNLIGK